MAENGKDSEKNQEKNIAPDTSADFSANEDLVDYIESASLTDLKAKYAAAEEDESIRNEGFGLIQTGFFRRDRPEEQSTPIDYNPREVISRSEMERTFLPKLANQFSSAQSEYDKDVVSFSEIDLNAGEEESKDEKEDTEKKTFRFGAFRKRKNDQTEDAAKASSMSKTYNTNTRVVYLDENTDDGIKRNTDGEVESLFGGDDRKPSRRKRK
ncbi:MAG: hypothetical protein IJT03_02015 [Clostridia bacterium]|nr:hypothetical protein [Clostridia bacterium]